MTAPIEALAVPSVTVLPLGGCGQVGMNATLLLDGQDALLIDCGVFLGVDEAPGVDRVIPDFSPLSRDGRKLAGVVLTSSVTGYRVQGAVPRQKLAEIRVPTLVVHHARDACKLCAPHEAKNIAEELTGAPVSKTVLVTAGSGESGDPCEPMHFHGYIGAEQDVVDMIAAWIARPAR